MAELLPCLSKPAFAYMLQYRCQLTLDAKITHDAHRGAVTFVRVYSGTLRLRETLFNNTQRKKERVMRLLQVHGIQMAQYEDHVPSFLLSGCINAATLQPPCNSVYHHLFTTQSHLYTIPNISTRCTRATLKRWNP